MGLEITGRPLPTPNTRYRPVYAKGQEIGSVTSAVYSPRLDRNIGLALVAVEFASRDTILYLDDPDDGMRAAIVDTPFISSPAELTRVFDRD